MPTNLASPIRGPAVSEQPVLTPVRLGATRFARHVSASFGKADPNDVWGLPVAKADPVAQATPLSCSVDLA